ncbi:nucleotidyltransferase family protein [Rhizobium tubonense]|nr:nucleotidyltransferase family protein [Rhizobium tubonense]
MTVANDITVAVVLLAAGRSTRMGEAGQHKLLAEFDGMPLVRRSAQVAIASSATSTTVVTGYRSDEIERVLSSLPLHLVENPEYASGMASSLIAGVSTKAAGEADGVMIMLADMPAITVDNLAALIVAFQGAQGQAIVRAVSHGQRGNPVILPRTILPKILELNGDVGARSIIEASGLPVIDVEIGQAALIDVDTPEQVITAGGRLDG